MAFAVNKRNAWDKFQRNEQMCDTNHVSRDWHHFALFFSLSVCSLEAKCNRRNILLIRTDHKREGVWRVMKKNGKHGWEMYDSRDCGHNGCENRKKASGRRLEVEILRQHTY